MVQTSQPGQHLRPAVPGIRRAGARRDTEAGQALVRVIIALIFAIYLVTGHLLGQMSPVGSAFFRFYIPILLGIAGVVITDVRLRPGVSHPRRAFCMATDFGSIAMTLIAGGVYTVPVVAVLLSVTVGYGMRFGNRYLIAATICATLTMTVVGILSPVWHGQPFFLAAAILMLLFVPVYALALLAETREAFRAADAANLAKARFLSHASHDLRQPIHAISLFTSSLREAGLGPAEAAMVGNIEHSLQTVTRMFRSLLDVATLDSGKVRARVRPVRLGDVLRDVVHQYDGAARRGGVTLRLVDTQLAVMTDPGLLTVMVQNLVSNAVKYAPQGKVLVGARRRGGVVSIWVLDQGIGIPAEHQAHIFDEFFRVQPRGRDVEGIGLGLAIVRRMAEVVGASVDFRSEVGRGTVVVIGNLTATAAPPERLPEAPAPARSLLGGARVLLIEDDPAVLQSTRTLMERWGCVVEACEGAPDNPAPCDLIVADFDLGGPVTGADAIATVRAAQGYRVPAVLVTAHDEEQVRQQLADHSLLILSKPLRPAELRSVMLGLIAARSAD